MTPGDDIILQAASLTKSFGRRQARSQVLRGVDLAVRRGEFVAVMGPSGCGKTTLLNILGLMSRPDDGKLTIDGVDTFTAAESLRTRLRRSMLGFIFQRFNLIGTINAAQNIMLSLRIRHLPRRKADVLALLDRMGVAHVAHRKSGQMSMGEQQRVAVARALAHRPALLLADEPTGSLDSANADALLDLLAAANAEGQTIVMITHSTHDAARADRILQMADGRIEDGRQ